MGVGLIPLLEEYKFCVDVVDVDSDPELIARYGDSLPVLLHEDKELCHYFLEVDRVREYLGKNC